MSILINTKTYIKIFLVYIIIFELIFQICFFFNFSFIKKPDLYYNGFCDQKYWHLVDNSISFQNNTKYHPILTIIKKNIFIPEKLKNGSDTESKTGTKKDISIYGSSYNNHNDFIAHFNNSNINFQNYALESYGLDQIYLSYKLTAHLNKNKTILIGFLLEDLDRSIFSKREYNKVKFSKIDNIFEIKNIPIDLKKEIKFNFDFYLFRFLKNFYNLISSDFDPRQSKCKIEIKKDLFIYFLNEIEKLSKLNNQKIIVITYNLKQDLINKPSWRYKFIKDQLKERNITHIDSYKILKNKSSNNLENIDSFFGNDLHNNYLSFGFIFDAIKEKL